MCTSAHDVINNGLSVGLLAADLLRLGDELEALDGAGIKCAPFDVMDGVFCQQMTIGPPLVKAVPDRFVKDVHLMIDEPLRKVHAYVEAGAATIIFHIESTRHPHRVLQSLAQSGVLRGVALNPGTDVRTLEPLLDELELVLVLAVNPGWSGQSFLQSAGRRLSDLGELIDGREIVIAIDGGITKTNIEQVASLGVDLIVTGSAVYDGTGAAENAQFMVEPVRESRDRAGSLGGSRGDLL
jgi:ribulose-phosphate 3-epimerase